MWVLDELEKRSLCNDIAIIHREKQITYRELWEQSESLAFYINSICKTKNPIMIYGNKEIEIIVCMMAALKTGRAYIPVDVTYPPERLDQIAQMANPELLFNFSGLDLGEKQYIQKNTSDYETLINNFNEQKSEKNNWVKDNDICYILFTSGSTGKPKGVQISKRNLLNFVSFIADTCKIEGSKISLNQPPYSFDLSVPQMYIFLTLGYTLFNLDKDMTSDFSSLFSALKDSDLGVWISTPSFAELCASDDSFNHLMLPKLSKMIFCGEILTNNLAKTLSKRFPKAEIINTYGPTEGTVLITACTITEEMMNSEKSLPIGYMHSNAKYKIENVEKNRGELVVVSDSISCGYFKNPEATSKVFFQDPNGRMGYHTGDLVYEENGLLYYEGRIDDQIKLNGYRIELDDIKENLNKIPCIKNSIVVAVRKDGRVAYLQGFVVLNSKLEMSAVKSSIYLKNELKKLIPSYMIPRKIIILDEFPLNVNGKIDRKVLVERYCDA